MKGAAFAPAHISGFFAVRPHPDPVKAGSIGCGLCLEAGVEAAITLNTPAAGQCVTFNGKKVNIPTVQYVVNKMLDDGISYVIDLTSTVPVGFGFGVSGAAALASALAINEAGNLGMTMNQAAAIAHSAEVANGTGLGDVMGQCSGGVVIRTEAGAPGFGKVDRIPAGCWEVSWVCLGQISTRKILSDRNIIKRVNSLGDEALKSLIKHPSLENFMSISKDFAYRSGLISSRAEEAVRSVEAQGGLASMAMLGDTVFAFGNSASLSQFGEVSRSRIGLRGPYLLRPPDWPID